MSNAPHISETEWEIMRVIWAHPNVTATEIIAQLSLSDPTWHPKTTRALIARLVQKGVLGYEAHDRAYVYRSLYTEQECVAAASESFLQRVFGGSLQPMLAFFVEQRRLTKKDLAELSELLEGRTPKPPRKNRRL